MIIMKCVITETGERVELLYIDDSGKFDYTDDIIGNSGAIGKDIVFDELLGVYRLTQATYDWWTDYLANMYEDTRRWRSLVDKYNLMSDPDLLEKVQEVVREVYAPVNMEDEHRNWENLFKALEDVLVE